MRLDTAIQAMREQIDKLIARGDRYGAGEHRDVLETLRMFANDRGWMRRLREAARRRASPPKRRSSACRTTPAPNCSARPIPICANGCMISTISPIACCSNSPAATSRPHGGALPDNAIIVARNMGPAALLDYDRAKLRGLVLEDGGPTSHVAIIARALGIAGGRRSAEYHRPRRTGRRRSSSTARRAKCSCARRRMSKRPMAKRRGCGRSRQEQYHKLRDVPAVTRDGVRIDLHMNAGLLIDCRHVDEAGAQSIGLFRTELQFMVASQFSAPVSSNMRSTRRYRRP